MYIQGIRSAGHNKYVLQPSRYKVLCLQATNNMSSSPIGTRYCVCRPLQICHPAQYIQGIVSAGHNKYVLLPSRYKVLLWLQATTNMSSSPVIQSIVAAGHNKYVLQPCNTKSCVCRSQHICHPAQ